MAKRIVKHPITKAQMLKLEVGQFFRGGTIVWIDRAKLIVGVS